MKKKTTLITHLFLLLSICLFAQNQGGPDTYGYTWKNQNATNGPTYNWIDITSKGTLVTGLGDDNVVGPFNVGFGFQYYWTTVNNFWVGSNGYVAFDEINIASSGTLAFPNIPYDDGKDNFVAPFLSDLKFDGGGNPGKVYYYSNNSDTLIVSFIQVPFWQEPNTYAGDNTFQIIFSGNDNSITFQYKVQSGSWNSGYNTSTNPCVIGIENNNGTIGLEHSTAVKPIPPLVIQFAYPDSVTYQVTDVKPDWINNDKNGGFFMIKDKKSFVNGSVSNVGNQDVIPVFDVLTEIYYSMQGAPSGSALYSGSFGIGNFMAGQSTTFSYGPLFTPTLAGSYIVKTKTNLGADDVNSGNDNIETELVVIDTVGLSQISLTYGGDSLKTIFGFEGAGVYYVPPFYPAEISGVVIYLYEDTVPANDFTVSILDDNKTVIYDTTIVSADVVTINVDGIPQNIIFPTPINITSGGFYITWEIVAQPMNTRVFTDDIGPFSLRTFEVLQGVIAPYRSKETEDLWINAILNVPPPSPPQAPIADFGATAFTALPGDTIMFYNHALTATSFNWTFENGTPATSTVENPSVSFSTVGTWDVQLSVSNSSGSDSVTKTVTIIPLTGIAPSITNNGLDVRVYPNPTSDMIMLDPKSAKIDYIEIVDIVGRVTSYRKITNQARKIIYDVSDLPSGIYFIKVFSGNKNNITRVSVIR